MSAVGLRWFWLGLWVWAAALPAAPPPPTFSAEAAPLHLRLTGFTRPRAEFSVVSEAAGRCREVYADTGETVPADGVLACLDATFPQLELEANQAEQARLSTELTYYEGELRRLQALVRNHSAAQAELDRSTWLRDNTRHQISARQIEQRRLQEQIRRFCIQAPPGWRVSQRQLQPGQWVANGQSVAQVGDFSRLRIPLALSFDAYQVLRATPSQSVELSEWGRRVQARLAQVEPDFDPQTRKLRLELELDEALPEARGGLRVELSLAVPDRDGVVRVPQTALRERYEEFSLVRPDGGHVGVTVLGDAGPGYLRVSSPQVRAGQEFLLDPPP